LFLVVISWPGANRDAPGVAARAVAEEPARRQATVIRVILFMAISFDS
jgi:hypothetical protein